MKGRDAGESWLRGASVEGRMGASEGGGREASSSGVEKWPGSETLEARSSPAMSLTVVAVGVAETPEVLKAVALSTQRTGPPFCQRWQAPPQVVRGRGSIRNGSSRL